MNIKFNEELKQYITGTGKGGNQIKFMFPNGYGASLICDGYGASNGYYEIAVLDSEYNIDYSTDITNDVLGWLTHVDVIGILRDIQAL